MNPSHFLLILLLATSGIACDQRAPQASQSADEAPSLAPILRDGVSIAYERDGQGDTTLLFVHGWCIDQSYWAAQVAAFRADYQVVTVDLPGFGASGHNRNTWSIAAYAQDMVTVIDSLGLQQVILIGHSMSGDVVLETTLQHEAVIAVIGVDNFKEVGMTYDEEEQANIEGFFDALTQNYAEVVQAYAEGALFHPSTDSAVRARVIQSFLSSDSSIAVAALKGLFAYAPLEAERLASLQQPLYLINSDASPTDRSGLDATGVMYEVLDVEATGHYPMVEKPSVFNQRLRQVLQQLKESKS